MISMNLGDITILNIYCLDYCFIIKEIGRSEAMNLLEKTYLTEKT